ncbi:MAG: GNAT family N-acetyltransferase [Erysipelotrichaceae bacterium]|nr:GNAT family N-acetyltransferase [Erysipelotrichaceae bacterium]
MKPYLEIYIPKVEDYWYEAKLQSDSNIMSYNAGWDVLYEGYHFETGCIDFPKEKWQLSYDKRQQQNCFFAYLFNTQLQEFVWYVNYHYNKTTHCYECGIVIEAKHQNKGYAKVGLKLLCNYAKSQGIKELYDDFEKERSCLHLFEDLGFQIDSTYMAKRFHQDIQIIVVKKVL